MKKIIALTGLLLLCASGAMAQDAIDKGKSAVSEAITAVAPSAAPIAKASKNVMFGWNTAATGYSIDTLHMNGTKCYGSAYDSTKIFFKDCTDYTAFAYPTSSVGAEAFADWTPM